MPYAQLMDHIAYKLFSVPQALAYYKKKKFKTKVWGDLVMVARNKVTPKKKKAEY